MTVTPLVPMLDYKTSLQMRKKEKMSFQPFRTQLNTQLAADTAEELILATESKSQFVKREAIDFLLSDYDSDGLEENFSEDEASEIANKNNLFKLTDEAKFAATMALRKTTPVTKLKASVKETGSDTLSNYWQNMLKHDLLRREDEVLLGRQVQILRRWEEVRVDWENEHDRTPTFSELANAIGVTIPELKKTNPSLNES